MKNKTLREEMPNCPKSKDGVHEFAEYEMIASGVIVLISGTSQDLGEETLIYCKKCKYSTYVRTNDLGSIKDMRNKNKTLKVAGWSKQK